jgi:hypothetical protein
MFSETSANGNERGRKQIVFCQCGAVANSCAHAMLLPHNSGAAYPAVLRGSEEVEEK